jgi:tetratricopeptide (TPR) repeat protein
MPSQTVLLVLAVFAVVLFSAALGGHVRACVAVRCFIPYADKAARVDALLERGRSYNARGAYDEAEYAYDQVLQLDSRNRPALGELADLLRHRGRYEESERFFQRAVIASPEDAWLYLDLGKLYRNMGRYDDALAMFNVSSFLDAREPYLWSYGYSQLYKEMGRYDDAEAAALRAIELDPEASFHYMSLGDTYAAWGRAEKAVAAYERAIELDSASEAYKGLGFVYLRQNNPGEARRWFELFNKHVRRPRGEVEMGLGYVSRREGKLEEAKEHFERAHYLDPTLGGEEQFLLVLDEMRRR